jgi:predicted acyltransferase
MAALVSPTASDEALAEPADSAANAAVTPARLLSLDVFRGLAVAAMILVNNPGSWKAVYPLLRHAAWHGCTLADLVFPAFLFIMGVSQAFSFRQHGLRGTSRRAQLVHVLWRSMVLVALGLLLNGLFYLPWRGLRLPGVLQRIGIVYCLAALALLYLGTTLQAALTVFLLVGYWLLMTHAAAPGHHAGDLSPAGNLASYLDSRVLSGHMWKRRWDPEGMLSTLPAVATTLSGALVGGWLMRRKKAAAECFPGRRYPSRTALGLLAVGLAAILLGRGWSLFFPMNKTLWTSSFVLYSGGWATVALGICYWLLDARRWTFWALPFAHLGRNSLAIYTASELVSIAVLTRVPDRLYRRFAAPFAHPRLASLVWALAYVCVWEMAAWAMHRKRIFLKL